MTDMVNHPPHYQTADGLEAIDVIKAYFKDNYNLGQVFKYIARSDKKWDPLEDLKKARWYLDKEIEWREEEEIEDTPPPVYHVPSADVGGPLSALERRLFGSQSPGRFL